MTNLYSCYNNQGKTYHNRWTRPTIMGPYTHCGGQWQNPLHQTNPIQMIIRNHYEKHEAAMGQHLNSIHPKEVEPYSQSACLKTLIEASKHTFRERRMIGKWLCCQFTLPPRLWKPPKQRDGQLPPTLYNCQYRRTVHRALLVLTQKKD